jgi:hypothetical protein
LPQTFAAVVAAAAAAAAAAAGGDKATLHISSLILTPHI